MYYILQKCLLKSLAAPPNENTLIMFEFARIKNLILIKLKNLMDQKERIYRQMDKHSY